MVGEAHASMVCRERELEQLSCSLGSALVGKGSVVVISGPSGIGKSMLAERTERMATRVGFQCFRGQCTRDGGDPAQPFLDAFPELFYEDGLAGPYRVNVSPLGLLDKVKGIGAEGPLLLRLENIHWAKREGATLLHHLARNIRGLKVLVLCTYRPEELTVTPQGPAPFLETVRLLRREGLCHEIELVPLGRQATIEVIEHSLEGELDDDLAEQLWQNSGGNPSVAIELARTLVQDRKMEFDGNVWRGIEGIVIELPDTFHELAVRNLDSLQRVDRMILECASVVGETFDPELVTDILGLDRLQVLERMDDLARENHLLRERGDQYQFVNRATHLAAYRGMPAARRKELHRKVAEHLERMAGARPEAIALQYYLADQRPVSLCYSLLAGQEHLEAQTWQEAVECFQRAVESADDEAGEVRAFAKRGLDEAMEQAGKKKRGRRTAVK